MKNPTLAHKITLGYRINSQFVKHKNRLRTKRPGLMLISSHNLWKGGKRDYDLSESESDVLNRREKKHEILGAWSLWWWWYILSGGFGIGRFQSESERGFGNQNLLFFCCLFFSAFSIFFLCFFICFWSWALHQHSL